MFGDKHGIYRKLEVWVKYQYEVLEKDLNFLV